MEFTEIDLEDYRNLLMEIHRTHMPFGMFGKEKYPPNGVPLCALPEEYILMFKQSSFANGLLGELMAHNGEIKELGMDSVFDSSRTANGGRTKL